MSMGAACRDRTHRAGGHWVVVQRNCHASAFAGYRVTWSRYSGVRCLECGAFWRTAARYVGRLRDAKGDESSRVV